MEIDWAKAKKYAQLVQVAGKVVTGDYSEELKKEIQDLGYSFLEPIFGNDFHGVEATFGFVAISDIKECVCALRGTAVKDFLEWLDDIEAIPVPAPFGYGSGLVHLGFKNVYGSLRLKHGVPEPVAVVSVFEYLKSLFATKQAVDLTTTGHSLGGALATLLVADFDALNKSSVCPVSYTFASPRVGDHGFMVWYDDSLRDDTYRVENCFDVVPNLPTNPPYEHVNTKFRVVGNFFEPVWKQHELATYLELIEKNIK